MSKASEKLALRESAIERLRELFPIGSVVSVHTHHVSRSGMMRGIQVLAAVRGASGDRVEDVSWLVARAIGSTLHPAGGVKVVGAGMDMRFHLIYALASVLYRDSFRCSGARCFSNDHVNDYGIFARSYDASHTDADRTAHCAARSVAWEKAQRRLYSPKRLHSDGGYALHFREV